MTETTSAPTATRADLHCHSTASAVSELGVSRALGLPECATPPEELTTSFAGEPQAVHVLCLDITRDDHDWLQAHADDVEVVAEYLREQEIACALAHPFFSVAAPLTARHRRRFAELFDVWEVRNGARAPELNRPAAIYVDTHGGVGIGGSDDHGGVDVFEACVAAIPYAPATAFQSREKHKLVAREGGMLRSADPGVLGLTLGGLAGAPSARRRLSGGGLRAVRERSWDAALGRLAEGWQLALAGRRAAAARAA